MAKKIQKEAKKVQKKQILQRCRLKIRRSQYSLQYSQYMKYQFSSVQILLKQIIKLKCCQYYYLRFPLESMLKGVCKKLMMNVYQVTIYGYFLEICEWGLNQQIFGNLYQIFPDIVHVNQPNNIQKLKQLSMFLYFSCYSIKQLLNENMDIFRIQILKLFPQFEHLHAYWVNCQQTTNFILNPKNLNTFYNELDNNKNKITDYNVIVDKIIQISPCYDSNSKPRSANQLQFSHHQIQHHKDQKKQSFLPYPKVQYEENQQSQNYRNNNDII